jgi:hypothetical protein
MTSFGGTRLTKGLLMLDLFTRLLHTKTFPLSLGRVFGKSKAPFNVAFFVWSASLGKIFTSDNLRKRQVIVINRCCLCKLDGEFVDHLFLHSEVARALWNNILSRFGCFWVMPNNVVDLMACWWSGDNSRSAVIWKMVPLCLMWCIRRERHNRDFDNLEKTLEELKSFFFYSLVTWTSVYLAPFVISYSNFLALFSP